MNLKIQRRYTILLSSIVAGVIGLVWLLGLFHFFGLTNRVNSVYEQWFLQHNFSTLVGPSDQEQIRQATASVRSGTFVVFSVVLGLLLAGMIGFILKLSKQMTKPVRDLLRYADEISRGNYDTRLEVFREDEFGRLAGLLKGMSNDLRRGSDQVRFLAFHDALTGLPNRAMLREYLDFIVKHAARMGQNAVVMFIDLDDFKVVNDTLGHDAGDWLLKEVSERVKSCIRQDDYVGHKDADIEAVVSRHGGDEFTVILPHVREPMNAAIVAKRIIDAVSAPFVLKGQECVVGASIGIAVYPNNGIDVDALLKNADIAMYQAKQEGKNTYKFYSEHMNVRALHKLSLESDIRKALDREEFRLWYQPQFDLRTGAVLGAEALLRWEHPKRGIVSPNEFIPVAERLGIITGIGEWVLQRACEDAKLWQESLLPDGTVAVNVSSVQFRRQDVPAIVRSVLQTTDLRPEMLHIEITETGLIFGDRKAQAALASLREQGTQVWVDDFGTGYSSLNYLRQFPVNGVKIDRSFMKDLDNSGNNQSLLVSAIISMCHSLGLKTVAEGIENDIQLKALRDLRCDIGQGYLLGKPMTLDQFLTAVAKALGKPRPAPAVAVSRPQKTSA